ncbi:hypothetical protein GCM10023172_27220 [Hymenobacter ginsengisoli]|uniref:VCBS repeat-containing protein n=1 Tax=Hymenobacter ginsengisoli TaxID=1051626 RepID=A0ABP8QGL1_9BACT|nr:MULTISPECIES: FG-GAP repeat protein [unclassified Hymenobacter]MBO2030023.1 FG-GAP repeat protein [Hymenobacter sp. BT559]
MRTRLLALLAVATSSVAQAQSFPTSAPTPAGFVPKGYYQLPEGRATGDLNGDGRPDVVLALAPTASTEAGPVPATNDNIPFPRLLVVLWRTASGYKLAAAARQAVLCKECGGVFGDPFAGLDIAKGVLSIYHYGGSSWRWAVTGKFRYQQGSFYQIGETYTLSHINAENCPSLPDHRPGDVDRDTNLLTGAYESVKVSDECKLLENRRGRQPVRPLRRLVEYRPAP